MQSDEDILERDDGRDDQKLETVEQLEVPFLNEMILALLGGDGEVYVPVIMFAQNQLGVAKPRNQMPRIRRDETLLSGPRAMTIQTAGGPQETKCLRIDTFALWLATISANMCKEEVRPILKRYKLEAAGAIVEHFKVKASALRARSLTPKLQTTIAEHDREIIALSDDMLSVKETLAIMGEMPEPRISIAQANQIQALVSKIPPGNNFRSVQETLAHSTV